jgi:O-antigen ligase
MSPKDEDTRHRDLCRDIPLKPLSSALLMLLIFSLAFMKPVLPLFGFAVVGTDFLFVIVAVTFGLGLLLGRWRFHWDDAYWLIVIYLGALALSVLASAAPVHSVLKLATVLYLALLAILTDQLVHNAAELRACLRAWLTGSAVVGAMTLVALAAFVFDPDGVTARYTRFHYGTLPPGSYPRFSLTFMNANMLCNYLTVSVGILLVVRWAGWLGGRSGLFLLAGLLFASLFTISPGLGGVLLLLGLWLWVVRREQQPTLAKAGLYGGIIAGTLFVVATAITPILHPTAPFLIHLPGITLAPSGRFLTWSDAFLNFAAHPFLGHGIGVDAVDVRYLDPSGLLQTLTDAHNTFLNIAAQAGLVGVAALIILLIGVIRRTRPWRLAPEPDAVVRLGLGLSFLVAFFYEGLGGSFEDARHLWVLLGLFIAASRIAGGMCTSQ